MTLFHQKSHKFVESKQFLNFQQPHLYFATQIQAKFGKTCQFMVKYEKIEKLKTTPKRCLYTAFALSKPHKKFQCV